MWQAGKPYFKKLGKKKGKKSHYPVYRPSPHGLPLPAALLPHPVALLPHPVSLHTAGNSQPPPYHQPPTPHSLNSPKPQTSNSCIMAETATPVGLGLTTPFSSSSPFCSFSRLKFPRSVPPYWDYCALLSANYTLNTILLYSMTAVALWADVRSSNKE